MVLGTLRRKAKSGGTPRAHSQRHGARASGVGSGTTSGIFEVLPAALSYVLLKRSNREKFREDQLLRASVYPC